MKERGPLLAALTMIMLLQAAPALAHAERIDSSPKEGARLRSAPPMMRIDFSEPPIGDANFVVTDGCDRDVVEEIDVQNMQLEATLSGGEPGRWQVETRVVSGVDGHATSDQWTFTVRGEAQCDEQPPPAAEQPPEGEGEGDQGGGSFPLLAFAAGTAVVIALALVFRGRSG